MTIDQPGRLDRIEAALERVSQQQEVNTNEIAELRNTVNALVEIATLHQRDIETSQRNFDVAARNFDIAARNFEAIQADIRGLQLENRRMLEELRGRRDNE